MHTPHRLLPLLAAFAGVGLLSLMDALMKSAALAAGTYTASVLRSLMAFAIITPVWLVRRPRWPRGRIMRLHIERGIITAIMALGFFYALTKLPIAEAIAISFMAPLIALYFAHLLLGEEIRRQAIWASLLGLAGTAIIVSGRLSRTEWNADLASGLAALALSALLYAYSFVIIRKQAQIADPIEIATFHSGISGLFQLLAAPFFLVLPALHVLGDIAMAAMLTVAASIAIAWAYAREEAQVLVPFEYTGFLWAALFGWLMFAEAVTVETLVGVVLIVIGCWIAAPRKRTEQTAL